MLKYRMARPDEREDYIDLANYAFKIDAESILPKMYSKDIDSSGMHMVAADERGRLRAQVAVYPEPMQVGGFPLRVGYLGIVSVHPRARGEGHMKVLMNKWLEEAPASYDMLVLYGQRQRYEYFDFTLGGVKIKYSVGEVNARHALQGVNVEGLSIKPLFEIEGAAAFAQQLNEARHSFVQRDVGQMSDILTGLEQQPLGVLDKEKLIGYLVVSKTGKEITELAMANTADIPRAVKAYLSHSGADWIAVYAPEYETELNASLSSFAENYAIETSDMYHIVDFARVLEAYLTVKHRTIGLTLGEFSAVLDGQPVTALVDESGVTVERSAKSGAVELDRKQAQTLLLTPHGRYIGAGTHIPAGWFPLPIFWYIADKF
ncbi:GNAT family N-acetyltransferase [Paenibacillus sp. OV219]|uniref:GNAT family N-acetyltransferase n=1 Tax=Paenibacillus sp. OV219 TaxID=1884377 RepID=UPI0008B9DE43|nr:GNAT family N-acetyltransferase [Paenibacillus sp. OV219]SEO81157.1 Acetyltransferase (GNAT) domain-containing protein [Paenibacillus sp. OV219]